MPAQQPLWADSYAPGVPLHLDYGDTTVLGLWESATQRYPDRPALDFLGRVSTYAEVADEIRHVAGGLHALGVRAGDNVALVMPNCPQNVIAFFAVLRLGATVVEHNPLYTAAELRHPFVDHGARVAIVWDKVVPTIEGLKTTLPMLEKVLSHEDFVAGSVATSWFGDAWAAMNNEDAR